MSLTQLFHGPEVLVAAGKEPFKLMVGVVFEPHPPAGQPRQNTRSRLGTNNDFVADKLKNRRDRLMRTSKWKYYFGTISCSNSKWVSDSGYRNTPLWLPEAGAPGLVKQKSLVHWMSHNSAFVMVISLTLHTFFYHQNSVACSATSSPFERG